MFKMQQNAADTMPQIKGRDWSSEVNYQAPRPDIQPMQLPGQETSSDSTQMGSEQPSQQGTSSNTTQMDPIRLPGQETSSDSTQMGSEQSSQQGMSSNTTQMGPIRLPGNSVQMNAMQPMQQRRGLTTNSSGTAVQNGGNAGICIGTMKALLAKNIGSYVVATFLLGMQEPVSWEGFLHSVGNDYLVIYQPDKGRYITGDLYSLKFIEFHDATQGTVPASAGYRRRDGQRIW